MTDIDALLCTDERRRIWSALRRGREIYITHDSHAVDRDTGERYGNYIAAMEIVRAGYARYRAGTEWVIEWNPRQTPTRGAG